MTPIFRRECRKFIITGIILRLLILFFGYGLMMPYVTIEAWGAEVVHGMGADKNTIFFLQVDELQGKLQDNTGRFKPVVNGGKIVEDDHFGKCLRFGDGEKNGITVADGGKINFVGGFTLEAWLYLEEEGKPNPGGVLAGKIGSFWFTLKDYKLNNVWMKFPADEVFTTTATQFKEFPIDGERFNGAMDIPPNRWVHLAITYDQDLKMVRTSIDGGIDRSRYLAREGDTPLLSDPTKAIEFMRGMKNFRVAKISLSQGPRQIGAVPVMEAYVQQLPYEDKVAISIDHIHRDLSLPLEVAVLWETPEGKSKVVKRVALATHERMDIIIDAPNWKGALHTVTIKAYSNHQMVFSRAVRISNSHPGGRMKINKDKSISVDGNEIFPLFIYHAFPEDYQLLSNIGFNIIIPRGFSMKLLGLGGSDTKTMADIKTCLNEAQKQHVFLMVEGNAFGNLNRIPLFKDHPALLAWAGFDEPWGTLEKVQESYNIVKLLDPDRPIFGTQNNPVRFAETAEGADIIACDPYPLPNVSLRHVAYHTGAAVRAVAGLKPVWTVLDQYGEKRPDLPELRCMAYLAIISGANGLGVYAWDDRLDKVKGWYTKEHPEDVDVLRSVVRELKSLEKVLLIPNSVRKAAFAPQNKALHAAIKEARGKLYLFVASDSRRAEEGSLLLEGIEEAEGACLFDGGGRENVRINGGRILIKLPPLGAAVYEVTANAAGS